jgi:molybdopterin converting factor small subunit
MMTISVNIKLRGIFRISAQKDELSLELDTPTVRKAVEKIGASLSGEARRTLIDPELNDPRPNALILVNGREISALKGLETRVHEGEEIVIIPVVHGG